MKATGKPNTVVVGLDIIGKSRDIANILADDDVGIAISPDRLKRGGRVDVDLPRSREPQPSKLSAHATRLNNEAGAITNPRYVSFMSDARYELQGQILNITSPIENVAPAARLAPSMMVADGPRTCFMGFQTNAEARGTGALLEVQVIMPPSQSAGASFQLSEPTAPVKPRAPSQPLV